MAMARPAVLFILRAGDTYTVSLEITTEGPSMLAGTVSVAAEDRLDVLTALERAVGLAPLRESLEPDPLSSIGRLMYGLFLPLPIQERLRTWDGPMIISTNDPAVPWELFHDGQDFLGLRRAVGRRLIMGRAPLARPIQRRERPAFLFIADPEGDLGSAAREAQYLAETLSRRGFACDLLLRERASYLNVQEALQAGRYDVIHYAGHALSGQNHGGESGLRLAGGRVLPASQVERVLAGNPLVFLNACSSGRESPPTAGERQVTAPGTTRILSAAAVAEGLASAFILGGAQGLIGTLWPVHDEGSRQFAATFYDRLLAGEAIGEVLRLTRANLRQQRPLDPLWAAFVLYGDPSYRLCEAPASLDLRPPPAQGAVKEITNHRDVPLVTRPEPAPVSVRPATPRGTEARSLLRTGMSVLAILAIVGLLAMGGWRAYGLVFGRAGEWPTPMAGLRSPSPAPELAIPLELPTFTVTPSPARTTAALPALLSPTPMPSPTQEPTAVVGLPATATPQQATVTPPLQGRIAFVSPDASGRATLYVMPAPGPQAQVNADGTELRALSPGTDPAWSPDGKRIAFAGLLEVHSGIYVINADGSGLVQLTNASDWQPTWSPDGRRIAFMSLRDGNREIYAMSADGSDLRRITDNQWQDRHPSWSPAGDQIAFISNRSGRWQVWVMAPDGSAQTALTDDDYDHFRPVWSPDGRQIAYGVWTGVRNEIWVMDADGSNKRLLTDKAVYKLEYQGYGLAWAPSRLISFVSDRDGLPQIYVMNPDGTNQRTVTAMPRGSWSPAWSFR